MYLKVTYKSQQNLCTEGPRITRILELTQNLPKLDVSKGTTKAKKDKTFLCA